MRLVLRDGRPAPEGMLLSPDDLGGAALASAAPPSPATSTRDDVFTVVGPAAKVPWMEAILGCTVEVGHESVWSHPWLTHPWDLGAVRLQDGNPWLSKLSEITRAYVDAWQPTVMVVQTLLRGPIDMLTALLGTERTVYAMKDHPEDCRALLDVCTEAFVQVATTHMSHIPRFEHGCTSPFGVWAPGSVVRTQCDYSALVGPRWYAEHVLPFDVEITRAFDYSVIHLHSGYLFTVDALLAVETPRAIQVSIDPGGAAPAPLSLIPLFRRILERKPLMIVGQLTPRELDVLLDELPGEGLLIDASLAETSAVETL